MRNLVLQLLCGWFVLAPASAVVAPTNPSGAELALAVDKLSVLTSVLYVAAHPDDENTALLSYLAQGRLARTAYLSITRGDGGQNLIGTELGPGLGLIRTQELLEARHRDGGEQFFTRAIDFGYTKSVDESLEVWGKDEVLGDVVRVIRRFRPDVIIMRFPGDGRGGHGQHTASAVLASEAFDAAADPARYPEQLDGEGLEPWQAKRLVWDAARFFGGGQMADQGVTVDTGSYSPLLGESFTEIAARSRSMHKSQGFGATGRRGSSPNRFEHRKGEEATGDLFDGIDPTWTRVPGGGPVAAALAAVRDNFDAADPAASVPGLLAARRLMADLAPSPWLTFKRAELDRVIQAACGLWLEVTADKSSAAPGDGVELRARAINRSAVPLTLVSIELPFGEGGSQNVGQSLEFNKTWELDVPATLPADATATPPYWLEQPPQGALYAVSDPSLIGKAEHHRHRARFTVAVDDQELVVEQPLLFRFTERVEGERYRAFAVLPRLSVDIEGAVHVFAESSSRPVTVTLKAGAAGSTEASTGSVRLEAPAGWTVSGGAQSFRIEAGESTSVVFEVRPTAEPSSGDLVAVARVDGQTASYSSGIQTVDYRHIPVQTMVVPAKARVVRLDLARRGERIGYVEGAGDEVPQALRQVGFEVDMISDEELASGDLGGYDAIVVGIRAYNARPAVRQANRRLLDYVQAGGTLVVQYNTISRRGQGPNGIGPYPFSVSRFRVSVEDAPVRFLAPEHPLMTSPNRLGPEDFDDWVQERGLYFPREWDERYTPMLSSNDPGEPGRDGGLLYAEYGSGVYIYTGYSFFRELPAGVAGAYRLFANLVSARQQTDR